MNAQIVFPGININSSLSLPTTIDFYENSRWQDPTTTFRRHSHYMQQSFATEYVKIIHS